ncbi:TVP38/TMEM64 family protein [Pseudalkalibacillus sp. Hm43]|uniref:TVP38/TMEM64 family protein n=1 Tax=Pseudalkalibacillus sp. Hm43 TaxID=3450742 RepID=UPI003F441EF1
MKKIGLYLVLIFIVLLLIIKGDQLIGLLTSGSLDRVVGYVQSWGIFAPLISIGLMIFQAIAAPIPAFLITATNGLLFGVVWGFVISWIGAMLGAIVSFYLAKRLGYDFVKKKVNETGWLNHLERLNGKYGFWIVLIARLVPVVSFDLISFAAGLAGMKLRTFLVSTGIGMLPATIAYTMLGHDMRNIQQFNERMLIIISALVGVTLIAMLLKKKYKSEKPGG